MGRRLRGDWRAGSSAAGTQLNRYRFRCEMQVDESVLQPERSAGRSRIRSIHWTRRRVLRAIARRRRAAFGGRRDQCPRCGYRAISYVAAAAIATLPSVSARLAIDRRSPERAPGGRLLSLVLPDKVSPIEGLRPLRP